MAEDSDENSEKVSEDSDKLKSQKENIDASEGSDSKGSSFGIKKFFKTQNLNDEEGKKDPERKTASEVPQKPETTEKPESSGEHHDHDLSFTQAFTGHAIFEDLKSHKTLIIRALSTLLGALLIVYGMFLFLSPTIKVADNVMFGDESAFAVLLILLGIIVIISSFAKRLFGGTFFHTIHKEIEAAEKKVVNDKTEDKGKDSKSDNSSVGSDAHVHDPSSSTDDIKDNNDKNNKDIRSED
ncbi:hypothetical protein [Methanobacterium aggregans]|uniref:hypothetical protein n=1 Tax=Methanobacterium aggregans TaxID=1615586 RepID=UPI001AE1CB83|nr:hypothetical protein [Methanobacterium aggregans]MBP2045845.1 Na+-transporting methylmalonyl-CoA/oxaloacetate decarboxylase gamma subunit [Methanobacterium aggregans]